MPRVRDLIAHILYHVNAEDATRNPSQVAGVARRAQYVRDVVAGLKAGTKDVSLDTILASISTAASLSADQVSFKRAIQWQRDEKETRPQLAIQAWVGKAEEKSGG